MKKWKIIKGTEEKFIGAPEWCTQVSEHKPTGTRMWEENFGVMGCKYQTLGKELVWQLDEGSSNDGFVVIAERVEVEEEMSISKGWLVNGKFTEDDNYANWASKHGYEVIALKEENKGPDILDIILKGSLEANPRPTRQVFKHLNEEVGEVGDALMAIAEGAVPDELVEGEVADVILCAVDLLFVHVEKCAGMTMTDEELVKEVKSLIEYAVRRKTQKWITKSQAGEYD